MAIHTLPTELRIDTLSRLGIKDLYRCKCVCRSWYKLIGVEFIIIEIMLRLPVQSLLRFKSASKYCYNLIIDMDFVRLHHKYQTRLNPSIIALDRSSMYSARLNPSVLVLDESATYNDYDVTELYYPEETCYYSFLGSCNGLLCFFCPASSPDICVLYNPATGTFSKVPYFPANFTLSRVVLAFGYDCEDKDYKIVAFGRNENVVLIYSLRTNSWRKTNSYPRGYPPGGWRFTMVFLNNTFHWNFVADIVSSSCKSKIMCFHLSSEQYNEMPVPKLKGRNQDILLSAPDGSHLHLLHRKCYQLDLWIMKEYGVKYSWVKLFSITQEGFDSRQFADPLVLAYLKGGSQILLGSTEKPAKPVDFMCYEFKTRKLKRLEVFDGLPRHFRARDPTELLNESVPITVVQWAESRFPLEHRMTWISKTLPHEW